MNKILSILMVAAVAATAVVGWYGWQELQVANAAVRQYEQELEEIRADLTEANFKLRGVTESRSSVPDSLKSETMGIYMQKSRNYRKKVVGYENMEREAKRLRNKQQRKVDALRKQLLTRLLLAGGAAAALAAALIIRRAIRS